MIFDAIASLLVSVFSGFLGLIPSYSPDFQTFGGGLGSALAGANSVFPVTTLGVCLVVVLGLRVFILGLTLLTWLWSMVPFKFS